MSLSGSGGKIKLSSGAADGHSSEARGWSRSGEWVSAGVETSPGEEFWSRGVGTRSSRYIFMIYWHRIINQMMEINSCIKLNHEQRFVHWIWFQICHHLHHLHHLFFCLWCGCLGMRWLHCLKFRWTGHSTLMRFSMGPALAKRVVLSAWQWISTPCFRWGISVDLKPLLCVPEM